MSGCETRAYSMLEVIAAGFVHPSFDYLMTRQTDELGSLLGALVALEHDVGSWTVWEPGDSDQGGDLQALLVWRRRMEGSICALFQRIGEAASEIARLLSEMSELTPYLSDSALGPPARSALGLLAGTLHGTVARTGRAVGQAMRESAETSLALAGISPEPDPPALQEVRRHLTDLAAAWRHVETGTETIRGVFVGDGRLPPHLTEELTLAHRFWVNQAVQMQRDYRAVLATDTG